MLIEIGTRLGGFRYSVYGGVLMMFKDVSWSLDGWICMFVFNLNILMGWFRVIYDVGVSLLNIVSVLVRWEEFKVNEVWFMVILKRVPNAMTNVRNYRWPNVKRR
jgi:hypothetical protein